MALEWTGTRKDVARFRSGFFVLVEIINELCEVVFTEVPMDDDVDKSIEPCISIADNIETYEEARKIAEAIAEMFEQVAPIQKV